MSSRRYVTRSATPFPPERVNRSSGESRSSVGRNLLAIILALATPAMLVGSLPGLALGGGDDYLLLPRSELLSLPTSGAAWDGLKAAADGDWGTPDLCDQDVKHGSLALAGALVYARTGVAAYATKTHAAIMAALGTERSTCSILAIGRQLGGYVLAADFSNLAGADDEAFRTWLAGMRTRSFTDHPRWQTLAGTDADSANNWGAFAGASRIAASLYLGDGADVAAAAAILRGFLGDRGAWAGFRGQGDTNDILTDAIRVWACDASPAGFVPINPACSHTGINLDGAIVNDVSRDGAGLTWPVGPTGIGYTLESLQGLVLQTELLYRNGYPDAWAWSDNALERAARLVSRNGAAGGTTWNIASVNCYVPWILNYRYGLKLPTKPAGYGRIFGYTDWLFGPRTTSSTGGGTATPTPAPIATPPTGPGPTATPKPTATPTPTATPAPTPTAAPTSVGFLFSASARTKTRSLTLTRPAATNPGDVLLAVIDVNGSKGVKVSAPAGWTQVRQDGFKGSITTSIYVRTTTASEPASYTFTTSRETPANGLLLGTRGADSANPVAGSSALGAGSSTKIVGPSVSAARSGDLLVGIFAVAMSTTLSQPSGMTRWLAISQSSSTGLTTALAIQTVGTGQTGDRIAIAGTAGDNIGQLLLLRPR
jgi:hypothetical protein